MRITLAERFPRDAAELGDEQRAALCGVVLDLPRALGSPHLHGGLGLRKLHRSGIFEARLGLGLRLVFAHATDTLTLVRVGSHDEIRRSLKTL